MNRVVTVVLNRTRARFFDVRPAGTEELACLHSPGTRGGKFHSERQNAPGQGERGYHGRVREEERRHLTAVVERLSALARTDAALELALAGPQPLTRSLETLMAPPLRARVIGTLRVDPKRTTASTITRQTRELLQAWARLMPG